MKIFHVLIRVNGVRYNTTVSAKDIGDAFEVAETKARKAGGRDVEAIAAQEAVEFELAPC